MTERERDDRPPRNGTERERDGRPPPPGWAGVADRLLALRAEQVMLWALIAVVAFMGYVTAFRAPEVRERVDSENRAFIAAELERGRAAQAERDERLGARLDRLEAAVEALRRRAGEKCCDQGGG